MAGSAEVGAVHVTLGLDSAKFEAGIRKAQEHLGSVDLGKGLLQGIRNVEGGLEELATKLGGFGSALSSIGGVGLVAAAALGATAEALHKTGEAIERAAGIGKLAVTLGTTTDFVQKFNFALRQSDIDVGAGDEALKALNATIGSVQGNLPRARQLAVVFADALHITPDQLRGYKDVADLFPVISEAIRHAGSEAEQAAIAKKFGIEALLPLLKQGAEGFNALAIEAQKLGVVLSEDVIKNAEEAKKKLLAIDDVSAAKTTDTFARFADTLIFVKEKFLEAKTAGLEFLAAVTGTQSLDQKIAEVQNRINQRVLEGLRHGEKDSFVEKQTHEDDRLLSGLLIQRAANAIGAKPEGGGAAARQFIPTKTSKGPQDESEQAIAEAAKRELAARIAITGDIEAAAQLRLQEIIEEQKAADARAERLNAEGKLTDAAVTAIELSNKQTADEKAVQIIRERDAALAQKALALEEQQFQIGERINAAVGQLALSAADRAKLEASSLAARQQLERDQVAAADAQQIAAGHLTEDAAARHLAEVELAQIAERQAQDRKSAAAIDREAFEHAQDGLGDQVDLLQSQAALLKSTTARADVEVEILKTRQKMAEAALQEEIDQAIINKAREEEIARLQDRLDTLKAIHANELKGAQAETSLVKRMTEAADAVGGLRDAIGRHDWGGIFDEMQRVVQTVTSAFANQGTGGGLATLASVAASALGGRAGNALGTGLSTGVAISSIAGILSGGALAAGVANGALALGASAGLAGSLGSGLLAAGAFLGPLAPVIGIIAGLATLLGNHTPSNFTASAAFNGVNGATFGGDKPNDATTSAVKSAADSILKAEQTLQAAGVTLTATVTNLELGQRDPSKVTLSNGQTVTAGVGDTAGAVDAALKAVLQGAQFTDAAEKSLVDSLLAAGKGFDDIVAALNNYQAAQAALTSVTDQILQLTDPQAADLKKVNDAIKAQKAAAQAAADAGYITAAQLAQVNDQLDRLQALQIDQVMAKYKTTTDAVTAAQAALSDARDREASAAQANVDKYTQVAQALQGFIDQVEGPAVTQSLRSLSANEARLAALARLGDADAAAQLPAAAQAFLSAATAQAHTAQEANAARARVLADAKAAQDTAKRQASIAQQQLDSLNATVDQLLNVNQNLISVEQAITNLAAAQAAAAAATTGAIAAVAAANVAQAGPSLTTTTTPLPASDPGLTAGVTSGDLSGQIAFQSRALAQIAKNTGSTADDIEQFTAVGIGTFAA